MAPRIGLDLLCLAGEWTGMAWQAWWLARLLPTLAPDLHFVMFLPPDVEPPATGPNVETVRVAVPSGRGSRLFAEQWHLPRAAMAARLDLLHTIAYGPPVLYRRRKLLTVHDLGFRILPRTLPARWRRYWNWAYGPAANGCVGWIAVSESTRRDMIRLLHREPAKIHVIPPGVSDEFFANPSAPDDARILADLGLPTHFLLHVGTLQPRKDIETLLGTFVLIKQRYADLDLVIVGGRGWGYDDINIRIDRMGLTGRVRMPGYVPAGARPALYRSARALLFTSRYEGFGLPLVEAMACGLPVVASDVSSIPEIVEDAGVLVPPGDTRLFADGVERLLTDARFRATLIERGRRQAKRYTWIESARQTADVYRDILRGPTSKGTS